MKEPELLTALKAAVRLISRLHPGPLTSVQDRNDYGVIMECIERAETKRKLAGPWCACGEMTLAQAKAKEHVCTFW